MGDPDQPHSYSYTPDVAAALVTLGTQPGATGSVWHLPVAETRTTRQIIDHVYRLAGHRPRSFAAGRTTLRLFGLIKPAMREYLHTLYQFTDRWVVDDTKFRTAFGDTATPLDDALAATLQWYHDARRADATAAARTARDSENRTHDHEATPCTRYDPRLAAAAMAGAAALAIAGFTALGSIFDYPADPRRNRPPTSSPPSATHQAAVTGWFLVLIVSAALLAPIGVLLGRIAGGRLGTVDRRPRRRRRRRPGHRPLPVGAAHPGRQRRRHRARPDRRRPPHLRTPAHLARQGPRRNHRLRPHRRPSPSCVVIAIAAPSPPLDRLARLRIRRTDRHRRRHPARSRARRASPTSPATSPGACGSSRWPSPSGAPGETRRRPPITKDQYGRMRSPLAGRLFKLRRTSAARAVDIGGSW